MPIDPRIIYFDYGCLVGVHVKGGRRGEVGRGGRRQRRGEGGGTDEQPLSDKPPLKRCGETYITWY